MEDFRERKEEQVPEGSANSGTNVLMIVVSVVALLIAALAFGYGYKQQMTVSQLTAHQTDLNSTIGQMGDQVATLTAKLNQMSDAQAAAANAGASKPSVGRATSLAERRRVAAEAKRMKEMQSQLDDERQQLTTTQDQIAQARTDLEGNLSSTRDELNGSIARTHEELVTLQQRGERDYFEFDLSKSKRFQHSGPVQLSLRKADAKHKDYDLGLIVDDNLLTKKKVNLYEPIWIHSGDASEPVQIVVNKITKDHVQGYVSAPKYAAGVRPASSDAPPDPMKVQSSPQQ
jgi:uncharacterized phage infection (PIP) family protein YhgE